MTFRRVLAPLAAALVAMALLGGGVRTAAAQDANQGDRAAKAAAALKERFAAADANGDGKLTKAEAEGHMPFVYKHFDEIDTAHAGTVTMADIARYAAAQRAKRNAD
ncbi:MAG: EF-hand domain-containing protein [Proteobacteria bacterium]|nr:EF-hand domain-containing protein [Pseudomonadota bacterium]